MNESRINLLTDKEKDSWEKFREQRKKDLRSPEFMYLHRDCYEPMAFFQFLQHKWSISSQYSNPFNIDDELEYAIRVHNFGPDIRQITKFYSQSYYLNKINQSSQQSPSAIKAPNSRPSYYNKGSQFGLATYKQYENVLVPNCPKRSDSRFNSPFSYYTDRRLKVIEKEKPNIKKSLILPEIVHEWELIPEEKKGQIKNIWKNYITIHHQLYQQSKDEKTSQVQLKTKLLNNDSDNEGSNISNNSTPNSIDDDNTSDLSIMAANRIQIENELQKNQDDLDQLIDDALKEMPKE